MARTLVIGTGGVIGGVALAFLLSSLMPVGEARLADPSTGFSFDPVVLLLGALAAIIVILALGVWPAVRTARIHPPGKTDRVARSSRAVALLGSVGASPSALIGVRHALERGRGRGAVPVGSALVGSILAVTALCATFVFGASLTHLTTTPALYGQRADLQFAVNQTGTTGQNDQMLAALERPRAISAVTVGVNGDITIDNTIVPSVAGQSLRGPLLITTSDGRLPSADDEVALGRSTLRTLGAHIGSRVRVTPPASHGPAHSASFRVVGTIVFPPGGAGVGLGTGALFTLNGLLGGACAPGPQQKACLTRAVISAGGAFLVRAVPGPVGQATLARLARAYPSAVGFPAPPTNLVNFGEAVNFPLIFAVVLIVFGVATLLHFLVMSVVRRRREVSLLKALGFVRRQIALAVSWQTTTIAVIGIIVGVPLGIAVGRLVWQVFATNLGVLPVSVVAALVLAAVGVGTLVAANLLAVGPALYASHSHPADALKAE